LDSNAVFYIWSRHNGSCWSFNGNCRVQIQWILSILTFNKAITIRILFCIYVHVNSVLIRVSTEISGYRYSGYLKYCRLIRPLGLKCCIMYRVTLLQCILEFQRKYEGTDTVDIENIDVNRTVWFKCCIVYMVTLLRLILEFQRKFLGIDPVHIENIYIQ
jgi:hypothetical protein